MEARTKIKIQLTKVDRLLETVCLALLVLLWIGIIAFFSGLPDQVPSHYNAAGRPDDFSDKTNIFVLPIVATIIYLGMTILNRHPHVYNYGTISTQEDAQRLYTSATKLIRVLKLAVVVIVCGIVLLTFTTAQTGGGKLGAWFLPLAVAMMILPNLFYLLKSSKPK